MEIHNIALEEFLIEGKVETIMKADILYMSTMRTIQPECSLGKIPINSYIYLPKTYKLPIRIDMTIKVDSPELYLLVGKGYVNFGTWSNRRIDDILEPNFKPKLFNNYIPINEYVEISVIYDYKAMQVLVGGEERYYSKNEKYIKSELLETVKSSGLKLKISCTKRTNLTLKSFKIFENYDLGVIHQNKELNMSAVGNEVVPINGKPNFESYIAMLSKELKVEIIKTNDFIMKLKPIKFKRMVDNNRITYVSSDCGFSYTMFISGDIMRHSLNWYVIHNNKYKYKEKDYMLDILSMLSPDFAQKIFCQLRECVGGSCVDTKIYEFNGINKKTCNGRIEFKMCTEDFEDVRTFIGAVNSNM